MKVGSQHQTDLLDVAMIMGQILTHHPQEIVSASFSEEFRNHIIATSLASTYITKFIALIILGCGIFPTVQN